MNTAADAAEMILRLTLSAVNSALSVTLKGTRTLTHFVAEKVRSGTSARERELSEALSKGKAFNVFETDRSEAVRIMKSLEAAGIEFFCIKDKKGTDRTVRLLINEKDSLRCDRLIDKARALPKEEPVDPPRKATVARYIALNRKAEQPREKEPEREREDL